ncbi:MAG: energy-coupled thiamine transporter ThiT [Clostridia bacterium]|nr:energy-coupled thiamine transporter ThiT [Clostridia bacterium]
MRQHKLHAMVECAIMIALATVLSMISIYKLPLGGSVTLLSMLPICLIGLRRGALWGFGSAFVYSVLQLLLSVSEVLSWGLTPAVLIACFLFDYIFAYSALGITSLFRGRSTGMMCAGIAAAMFVRFLCHLFSGVVLFAAWAPEGWNPFVYSVVYNGAYMLPEMILTMVAVFIINKTGAMNRLLAK